MRELRAEEEEDSEDDQEPGTPAESGSEDELEANGQAVSPSFGGPGLDGHEASGASEESDDDLGEARESDGGQGVQHQTQNSMWAGAESEEEDDEELDVIIDEQQGQEDDVVGTNQTLTPTEQELPTYGRVRHGRTPRSPEGSEEDVEPPPRLRRRRRG
ncbi:unnamed protein product [Ostreobium quekettii]|uniref:Uncharacterized protein n=1 Tax=Ostreobium quekettii TaxID=121088 RepID=A0A8S1JGM2_9CHLO|nr:unnamed protein product [Ostreobium quekettii]